MRTQRRPKQRKKITRMKTKLIKNLMAPLVVAIGLVSMAAAGTPPKGSTEAGTGGRLQGTWYIQRTLTDCASHVIWGCPSLIELVAGATVVEANGSTRHGR